MKELTTTEMWLFICLYGVIAIVYLRYIVQTIVFWVREKPKKPIYKWSFPKPMKQTKSTKQLLMVGLAILCSLFILQGTGKALAAVLFGGFLFAYFRLKREFHVKVYVTEKNVIVWSVFPNDEQLLWKGKISKKEWQKREETEKGYIVHTKEGVFQLKCRNAEKQKLIEKMEKMEKMEKIKKTR